MKYLKGMAVATAVFMVMSACAPKKEETAKTKDLSGSSAVDLDLGDGKVKVDGVLAGNDESGAVYVANDIIYYEAGHDFTYGEGSEKDAHTKEEAMAQTVVHISRSGVYNITGKLPSGQIAVDLGEEAKEDPEAVVTLVLNGVDITCDIAPAVIFYSVYECGSDDEESATKDVDTTAAGANVVIADGTENIVNGSYVAKIYKPGTLELSEDGKTVKDAKKLHKYDGAFYSKMSMNINGEAKNTGVLNINAKNEGLDSELHLTLNGGNINIKSGNDGINTNADNASVTTINGGNLTIKVTGETGEGDGIDSNGFLVINGGSVVASACSSSGDSGIDSDKGIYINGGTVIATGNMLDRIEDGGQSYCVFNFSQRQDGKNKVFLRNEAGENVMEVLPENDYSILIYSSPDLKAGNYTLWSGENQLVGSAGGNMMGGPGGNMPFGEGERPPFEAGKEPPQPGELPENMPEDFKAKFKEGETPSFDGKDLAGSKNFEPRGSENQEDSQEKSVDFVIKEGSNMFSAISLAN